MTREDQIAAEIAARYGVAVMPGAVQVLPPCTYSWQVETPVAVAPGKGVRSGALRRKMDAQYANLARAARLRKADAAQDKGPTAAQVARAEAIALREAQLRAMVAEGLPRQVIADRMGIKVDTLQAYARGLKIKLPPTPKAMWAKSGPKPGSRAVVGRMKRDDAIRERVLAGEPVLHIARALGVPTPGVYRAVRRMGLPVVKVADPSKRVQVRDARLAFARSLLDSGLDATAVAGRLMAEHGVTLKTARRDMAALGRRFKLAKGQGAGPKRSPRSNIGMTPERLAEIEARRVLVRELAFGGATRAEIRAKTGATSSMLVRDLRALTAAGLPDGGRDLPAFARSVDVAARDARWDRIEEMRMGGATLREISAAVGLSLSVVCVVCRRAGLVDTAKYAEGRRAVPDDEARRRIGEMLAAGFAVSTMRRKIGLSKSRLDRLLAEMAAGPERRAA